MQKLIRSITLLILSLPLFLAGCAPTQESAVRANVVGAQPPAEGFARAEGPVPFVFPQDFGPHPQYQTEWWYYTGNLETADGRHFGYQLTFFRRALLPADQVEARASDWATSQVYFAHFALTDVTANLHYGFERFGRGVAGIAGAQADPYRVWLEDWEVAQLLDGTYTLFARQDDLSIALTLEDQKGAIPQGIDGYSQKGPEPGNASYYYSQPRLASTGTIEVAGKAYDVAGMSWKDHEYSTSALGEGLVGWDWFAVQLDDGRDLMLFQLRHADGSIDPFSSGTLIAVDGSTQLLAAEDFEIKVGDTWTSPRSGAQYPARWTVRIPDFDITLEIVPYIPDQEMNVSFVYWEGAVQVTGQAAGDPVAGQGYVELTGYAASMKGEF
ncbi:MAG: hypothetical protein JW862_11005 [Anaerolineales bacterium]|nr:hypothetical protein [Anaerolineales bacterium]